MTTEQIKTHQSSIGHALGLFRSAIRSGEDWTTSCDEAFAKAQDALTELVSAAQHKGG